MADLLNSKGAPFVAPKLGNVKVQVPGPGTDDEWKDLLADWADLLGKIPSMSRREIYATFGKAKPKTYRLWEPHCEDEDCDRPPIRSRLVRSWTRGVRPHKDVRILRRRAIAEHLRNIPHRPYRYAGVELRRPPMVVYKDGI